MDHIRQQLANHDILALDSSIFIYHFEAHPTYLPLTKPILEIIASGTCQAVISTITLMELTVLPWRQGRADVARQYELLLVNFPNLTIVDVSRDVARRAAQLRALYNIRPADALFVATGLVSQATAWVTNDKNLRRLAPELEIFVLDSWL
ncbi:MAG: type II toxin-antitoxin system VapC family toxin [Chloroflexi bacterium]|nr:type II toxin-antitoxin system VapC family toxin [Chloroflexota bacterium]